WDKSGQMTSRNAIFSPGRNKIDLLKSASKYKFKIEKWGTVDEMELTRTQVQQGALYVFGGSKQAKKLSEVLTAKIEQGVSKPFTRSLYNYNSAGKIAEILTFKKRADNSTYLDLKQKINYDMGRVESVSKYNEEAQKIGSTHFSYKTDGKLSEIIDFEGEDRTTAAFTYLPGEGGTGISGDYTISGEYSYTKHYYTAAYSMFIRGGNVLQSLFAQSNARYEKIMYDYDFAINPYVHLNLPDLYLSNYSKHNPIREYREIALLFPLVVPYQFNYKYDSDGYPTELVVKYKTYLTGEHAYDIKTLFKY
ncbi:MAG TPA: hypothetical protein VK166_10335, partial [Chitinophagaceae bacterium]|nr:hypothetical protein [Chitinophagaceae bacterium]